MTYWICLAVAIVVSLIFGYANGFRRGFVKACIGIEEGRVRVEKRTVIKGDEDNDWK